MDKHIPNFKGKGRARSTAAFVEPMAHPQQVRMVNGLLMAPPQDDAPRRLVAELKRKRNGYKAQDVRREVYDADAFISLEAIIEHLVVSRLKCAYCHENVEAIYTQVRSPSQWTLDRIDNTTGHTAANTIVSCLRCNLHRRTTDYEKFKFTKNLRLIKTV